MQSHQHIYIDGQWIRPQGCARIALENPATQEVFSSIPACNQDDAISAIEAAHRAWPAWAARPMDERIELMGRMLAHFQTQRERIIELEAQELGAPVSFSRYAHCERQFARIAHFIDAAEKLPLFERYAQSTVYRESMGVVSCITPWNYPLGQIIQKVIPALLMGNTVVLKPSSRTPLTALLLIDAFDRAGFPAGVINLVLGSGRALGDVLVTHPLVAMVSFTGSTDVGKTLMRSAADSVKKVSLELGGKSPYIWLKSDDYEPALNKLVSSIFMNSGQTCTALSRLIVPEQELAAISALLVRRAQALRVGDPTDPATDIGPVASRAQYDRVRAYIALGLEEGATLLAGGLPDDKQKGYYIAPTIFTHVTNDMRIAQEEIFGPVLCVMTYRTIDEAVSIANDTPYGLNAAVFGPDREQCLALARRLQAGGVYINDAKRDETAPFGGYKQSGHGREGGRAGLMEFSQTKTVLDNGA